MSRSPLRVVSIAAVLAAAGLGLAGCLDSGFPTAPTSSASPSPSRTPVGPTGSANPSATAGPSVAPTASPATPLSLACDALIPLQPLYDLNPNYALVPVSSAASGTLAAAALADKGTACQVVHTSSGATAVVTISQPSTTALAADEAAAGSPSESMDSSTGNSVTIYGSGSELQAFTAKHRFTAEGDASFEPEDLKALIGIAVSAQG